MRASMRDTTMRTSVGAALAGVVLAGAGGVAVAADIPPNGTTQAKLPISSTYTKGTFENDKDHDWYRVTLQAGKDYAFSADTSLFNLRQAGGKIVARNDGGGPIIDGFVFTPETTGTYFLDVGALGGGFFNPSYIVRAMTDCRRDLTTKCDLALGETRRSTATYDQDTDWFRVTLDARRHYMFSGNFSACCTIAIVDGSRNYLALSGIRGTPDGMIRNFTPPVTGVYYVSIVGDDGARDYNISFKYETDTSLPPSLGVFP